MSSSSSLAELHRIIRRSEEAEAKYDYATAQPHTASDPTYFDHVGAHFQTGPRKGSLPLYPDGVELGEDEAQPGGVVPGAPFAHHVQHSLIVGSRSGGRSVTTRHLVRDHFCISQQEFEELQRQRSGGQRCRRGSSQSQHSQGSTPNQAHAPSLDTMSSHSEIYNGSALALPLEYNLHLDYPAAFSDSHTPSRCSTMTNKDETYREAVGPSPPHPFSTWDLYESKRLLEDMEIHDDVWASSQAKETVGQNCSKTTLSH